MRKSLVLMVATAAAVAAGPALARDGCGPDRYRSSLFGHCHWAGPPPPAAYYGPGPADQGYYGYGYRDQGYWHGRRYWNRPPPPPPPAYGGWRY